MLRIATGDGDDFVAVSPRNAAYTRFLLELKATGTLPGEVECFVALDGDGERVGRMAATVGTGTDPDTGLLGLLAVDERLGDSARATSVVGALLSSCERWLLARGVEKVYGPVDFTTFFEYRFRDRSEEEDFGHDFSWEPAQPPCHLMAFEAAGYVPVERYHSVFYETGEAFPLRAMAELVEPAWRAAVGRGMEFTALDEVRPVEALMPTLAAITFDAFKDNFLYSPIPGEVFEALYLPVVREADLSLSHLVHAPDGQAAGFVYAFEDSGYCVVKSIAVRPAWRGQHLWNALVHLCLARAAEKGLTRIASALVREGNVSELAEQRYGGLPIRSWKHHYVLLGKTLGKTPGKTPEGAGR